MKLESDCCNAEVYTWFGREGTSHYRCKQCEKACDVAVTTEGAWALRPSMADLRAENLKLKKETEELKSANERGYEAHNKLLDLYNQIKEREVALVAYTIHHVYEDALEVEIPKPVNEWDRSSAVVMIDRFEKSQKE